MAKSYQARKQVPSEQPRRKMAWWQYVLIIVVCGGIGWFAAGR